MDPERLTLPTIAPTPIASLGISKLFRFYERSTPRSVPLLLVPSPIARWRHLHPKHGASLLRSISEAGYPTYCLDWGEPIDHERDLSWDDMVLRVRWARYEALRDSGSESLGLIGFSLGGTLAVISAAMDPASLLVNLSGPVDFDNAGPLVWISNERWFDPAVPAAIFRATPPAWMKATLALHRASPTRWWLDRFGPCLEASSPPLHEIAETWSQHHVPLPPAAFVTYVEKLVQRNELFRGCHRIADTPIDLKNIRCPVLAIGAKHDSICHPLAVTALLQACGSNDTSELVVPGGHLSSVVGRTADRSLHDPLLRWLDAKSACAHSNWNG